MTTSLRPYFPWCDVFGSDDALVATGVNTWACLVRMNDRWNAVGGGTSLSAKLLALGYRKQCTAAADDWLYQYETAASGYLIHCWLKTRASSKQLQKLQPALRTRMGMTRYQATALLHFQANKAAIVSAVRTARDPHQVEV